MQVLLCARPWAALLVGAGLALAAAAQMRPADSDAPTAVPGQVLSDVQPLPAEDRESAGAVKLRDQPVRAQQSGSGPSPADERKVDQPALGARALRMIERTRSWSDVREEPLDATTPP